MEQINSFLSQLKTLYSQQGQIGKILIPGLFLLACFFLCSILIAVFSLGARNTPHATASPYVFPSAVVQATPTALFNFGAVTFTPFPTFPPPTPFPTLTSFPTPSLPTPSPTATQMAPTATITPFPTATGIPVTGNGSVVILTVNKRMEYAELQNVGSTAVDLSGWKLVSQTGNQVCALGGVLQPGAVLRVWAGKGTPGFSCGFSFNIWNDSQRDRAILYNAQGQEVSRYP